MENRPFGLRIIEWGCWTFFGACAVVIGRWTILKCVNWAGWGIPDWAAWIQAIGSIAAIAGAAWIAGAQSRSNDRFAKLNQLREDLAVAQILMKVLETAVPIVKKIEGAADGARWEEIEATEPRLDIFKATLDVVYARAVCSELIVAATSMQLGLAECLVVVRRAGVYKGTFDLPQCEAVAKAQSAAFERIKSDVTRLIDQFGEAIKTS